MEELKLVKELAFGDKARRVNLREKLEVDKKYISKLKKTNAINIVYK